MEKGDQKRRKGASAMKPKEEKGPPKVDRSKTCPFLMKVFLAYGGHNSMNDYKNKFPCDEVQIYTWMDATLFELMNLIKEVKPVCRRTGTVFDFALVYPVPGDYTYRFRNIGSTCSNVRRDEDMVTLSELSFQIGDYMDIAVTLPILQSRRPFYNPHFQWDDRHHPYKG